MLEHTWDNLKILAWNAVWASNLAQLPRTRAGLVRSLRVGHMLVREISEGQLKDRAASLVYTTLLSLIPVLAVTFWVLKAFDVHHEVEPALLQALGPLGDKGFEIGVQIIAFVEALDVRALGSMGLAVLIFTVVSLLYKIEQAFNYTWRVTKPRSFASRLSGYLTVVMIGPVLVVVALGVGASLMRNKLVVDAVEAAQVGAAVEFAATLVPYLLIIAAFTFVYVYMPNTKVRLRSALVGALFAGVLWASAGWLFGTLVVTSTRYTAIYSSFAILILFMMWLYIGWLILLAGGVVAFYQQNPEYLGLLTHEFRLSSRMRERIAMSACFLVAQSHVYGTAPWTTPALAARLGVPVEPLAEMLGALERAGILARAGADARAWLPARDLGAISVVDTLQAVRTAHEGRLLSSERVRAEAPVETLIGEVERAVRAALEGYTVRELAERNPPAATPGDEPAAPAAEPVPIESAKREGKG